MQLLQYQVEVTCEREQVPVWVNTIEICTKLSRFTKYEKYLLGPYTSWSLPKQLPVSHGLHSWVLPLQSTHAAALLGVHIWGHLNSLNLLPKIKKSLTIKKYEAHSQNKTRSHEHPNSDSQHCKIHLWYWITRNEGLDFCLNWREDELGTITGK